MRLLWVSYSSPKEHRMLLLKVPHVSHYVIPNIWLQRTGEVIAVSTNAEIRDKKSVHLLIVGEQLFQPYTYVSVTLYLHFHVVNPRSGNFFYSSLFRSLVPRPYLRERVWWHPADFSGFINVDYFLERNFSPPIALQKTQSVVQHWKFLATSAWWHSTFLALFLVVKTTNPF